jgi:hypothetical protein
VFSSFFKLERCVSDVFNRGLAHNLERSHVTPQSSFSCTPFTQRGLDTRGALFVVLAALYCPLQSATVWVLLQSGTMQPFIHAFAFVYSMTDSFYVPKRVSAALHMQLA